IQIPAGTELPLDGFFGLNPAFGDLQGLYQSGHLAFLHAAGSPDPSRSHFDAQDFMDRAAPGNKSVLDGWLNRYLAVAGGGQLVAGISLSNATSKSLAGPPVGNNVLGAFDAIDLVDAVDTTTSVVYPAGELGAALKDAAALIRGN